MPREDPYEERDELFEVQIYDVKPEEVRISKRDKQLVQIITDHETASKEALFRELINRVHMQEKMTWWQQIEQSITLHPTKDENGIIIDVE